MEPADHPARPSIGNQNGGGGNGKHYFCGELVTHALWMVAPLSVIRLHCIAHDTRTLMNAVCGTSVASDMETTEEEPGEQGSKDHSSMPSLKRLRMSDNNARTSPSMDVHPFPDLIASLRSSPSSATGPLSGLTAAEYRLWDTILPQSALCPDVAALFDWSPQKGMYVRGPISMYTIHSHVCTTPVMTRTGLWMWLPMQGYNLDSLRPPSCWIRFVRPIKHLFNKSAFEFCVNGASSRRFTFVHILLLFGALLLFVCIEFPKETTHGF